MNKEICHLNYNLKHLSKKYKSALKLIRILVVVNFFSIRSCKNVNFAHGVYYGKTPLEKFKHQCTYFKKFLEDMSPFCGATDNPVLDFW